MGEGIFKNRICPRLRRCSIDIYQGEFGMHVGNGTITSDVGCDDGVIGAGSHPESPAVIINTRKQTKMI